MIDIDRRSLVIMMEAGYIYLGMRRFAEARKVFEGITVLAPQSDVPLVALGNVAFCQGNFTTAIQLYRRALTLTPASLFAKVYLGEALFFGRKKTEALELLVEVRNADATGAAGGFATSLIDAIHNGFTPRVAAAH